MPGDRIQKPFDQKELQTKMSSVMPFTFNAIELCVVAINKNLGHVPGKCVRYLNMERQPKAADILRHLCSRENYAYKWQLTGHFLKPNL